MTALAFFAGKSTMALALSRAQIPYCCTGVAALARIVVDAVTDVPETTALSLTSVKVVAAEAGAGIMAKIAIAQTEIIRRRMNQPLVGNQSPRAV